MKSPNLNEGSQGTLSSAVRERKSCPQEGDWSIESEIASPIFKKILIVSFNKLKRCVISGKTLVLNPKKKVLQRKADGLEEIWWAQVKILMGGKLWQALTQRHYIWMNYMC